MYLSLLQNDEPVDEILLIDLTYYAKRSEKCGVDYPFKHTTSKIVNDMRNESVNYKEHSLKIQERLKIYVQKHDSTSFPVRNPRSTKCGFTKVESVDTGLLGMKCPITTVPLSFLKRIMDSTHSKPAKGKTFKRRLMRRISRGIKRSPFGESVSKSPLFKSPQANNNLGIILESETPNVPEQIPEKKPSSSDISDFQKEAALLDLSFAEKKFWRWNLEDICCQRKPPENHYYINQETLVNDSFPETAREYLQYKREQRRLKNQTSQNQQEEEIEQTKGTKHFLPKINSLENKYVDTESVIEIMDAVPSFTAYASWLEECERLAKRERILLRCRHLDSPSNGISQFVKTSLNFKPSKTKQITGLPRLSLGPTSDRELVRNVGRDTLPGDIIPSTFSSSTSDPLHSTSLASSTHGCKTATILINPDSLSVRGSKGGSTIQNKKECEDQATQSESGYFIDDKTDDVENSPFLKKLNREFSRELFISKTIDKNNAPLFYSLKKRFGVHRALVAYKACRKAGSTTIRPEEHLQRRPRKARELLVETTVTPEASEMVLGKIRPFKFLEYRNYKSKNPQVTPPEFTNVDLENFKLRLQKAVDEFVIRKENVITSYGYKYMPSITFTRPSVFRKFNLDLN